MTLAVLSFRIPWKAMAWLLCAAAIAVAVVNINARNDAWLNSPYLARLIHLVRLENPANKSPERMYLYHKAAAVLREKPLVGGGVGSFYLDSPKYAAAGDPNALVPDFAHNAFLQLAVDVGIPAAAVFALIVASSFLCAFRRMRRLGPAAGPEKRLLMGASFALAAYLMTQMTGNSLNVYPSNQFIFWLLTAFLMRPAAGGREDRAHEGA
jgi:O-antigen ligase